MSLTREPWHGSDPFHRWSKFQAAGFRAYMASIRPSEMATSPLPHAWWSSPFEVSRNLAQSRFEEMRHNALVEWMGRSRKVHTEGR